MKLLVSYLWQGEVEGIVRMGSGITVLSVNKRVGQPNFFGTLLETIAQELVNDGRGIENPTVHIMQLSPASSIAESFVDRHPIIAGALIGTLIGVFCLGIFSAGFLA